MSGRSSRRAGESPDKEVRGERLQDERLQKERLQDERPQKERLQKILARSGLSSRRKAEELIEQGRVTVNGVIARLGDRAVPGRDSIKVDGKAVKLPTRHRYLLLNKPSGVMTTREDPEGRRTVLDLIPRSLHRSLVPVGRLDYRTQGLLLLTTDGDLAQLVAHPSHGCTKTYEVKVKGVPSPEAVKRLREGVVLAGRRTSPTRVSRHRPVAARGARRSEGNSWWLVELREGRTRQIREMFRRVGHPVQRLRRIAIGSLRDPALPLGRYRELTDAEVANLRAGARSSRKRR